ncbi:metallophosphoesterase family protein [Candidatus Woesearchaeota archaeon]|nr:metallophosphoesterase family protein [Candidatus Woesearchaeota archaeon]
MKALFFVDTHGRRPLHERIKHRAQEADVLVCAGDLTEFGEGYSEHLAFLDSIGKPVVLIHGNHESELTTRMLVPDYPNIRYIHGGAWRFGSHLFLGYGGGGFVVDDEMFEDATLRFDEAMAEHPDAEPIMVVHQPPHDIGLDEVGSRKTGNRTMRSYIERVRPKIVVFGHLHMHAGEETTIGGIRYINPGPGGLLLDLSRL